MIDLNNIDDYAAEYVLGTLDQGERDEMANLRNFNPAVARSMTAWESRLTPLCERMPNEMPSPDLFAKIEARIATMTNTPEHPVAKPSSSRWQSIALAMCLLLVVALGAQYISPYIPLPFAPTVPSLVAVLQADPSKPLFVISVDPKAKTFGVRRLVAATPANKDYELWIIPQGEKDPRPVGVVSSDVVRLPMVGGLTPDLLINATLAITIEPRGGSPTGFATGPIIVTGKLVQTSL